MSQGTVRCLSSRGLTLSCCSARARFQSLRWSAMWTSSVVTPWTASMTWWRGGGGVVRLYFNPSNKFLSRIKIKSLCYLRDEAVSRVLHMRRFLSISDPLPLPVVHDIIQLRRWPCHVGHFHQVGASHALRRMVWVLRLRLCLHSRGHDHLRKPGIARNRVDCGLPLGFHVQAFQVGGRRSQRWDDAGLAEPAWVLLNHHAASGRRGNQESAVLIHPESVRRVRPRMMSTYDWLQTPGNTWRHRKSYSQCYSCL